jgi:hypothetical protein
MIISLALVVICTACGAIATYLYDEGASVGSRLCTGACVGLTVLGLIGFIFASFLGLTTAAISLTILSMAIAAGAILNDSERRALVRQEFLNTRHNLLHPRRIPFAAIFYLVVAIILWRVFDRAMIEAPDGLYTGVLNNFGDLPFHLSVITGFAFGNNFPPEDPTYAGVRFTYPFLTDFISAIFVRCGANLRQSMFLENFVLAFAFVGLVHRWALELLKDRLAAYLTPIIVLLSGGFGWVLLWEKAFTNDRGLLGVLKDLPPSFTVIPETTWRWGNAISALLIPQRGMLLGLALAVIVFTQWWLSEEEPSVMVKQKPAGSAKAKRSKGQKNRETGPSMMSANSLKHLSVRRMIAAGIIAGLLPLVHAHSFVVVMTMGGCLALLQRRWRDWITFFVAASVIALPQMWWSTHGSAVDAKKFFEWQVGWDRGADSTIWFWLKNTGLFIPLIIAAVFWRGKDYLVNRRLLVFYLPFTLCFLIPNVIKMAPWIWDNIKVLFYWWLASAPLVALLLSRLWREGGWLRPVAVVLCIAVTLAGALDVAGIALRRTPGYQVFNANGISFAEVIKQRTDPRALIIHAPVHNDPVFLSGRRSLLGYPGHIWTHGLDFVARQGEIKRIYSGAPDARQLLQQYKIEYAVVGPLERNVMPVNEQFFAQFPKVGEVGEYRLYKITAQ